MLHVSALLATLGKGKRGIEYCEMLPPSWKDLDMWQLKPRAVCITGLNHEHQLLRNECVLRDRAPISWEAANTGEREMLTHRVPHPLVVIDTRDELTSGNIMYILFSFIKIKTFYNLKHRVVCVAWSKNSRGALALLPCFSNKLHASGGSSSFSGYKYTP